MTKTTDHNDRTGRLVGFTSDSVGRLGRGNDVEAIRSDVESRASSTE
jgi:hypothetical protein